MKQLAFALALSSALAIGVPVTPAAASIETYEAKQTAASAAEIARADMIAAFGDKQLKPGQYLWRDEPGNGPQRIVVSLSDQLAYLYRGDTLVAVSTISSGKEKTPTPTGIFNVLEKKPMHHSRKYDNAPMPFMQRIDQYGIALHAGHLPGHPASHGCIRLPSKFAAKLFAATKVGTTVLIGA
ncbi:MAG TPA: L,D-transpeptidase family protein [Sphingomicrobium sp.]|nr:L,D-transpeptidase family protein [Sphingomicrobium sp.]